jgi:hypothetical protein
MWGLHTWTLVCQTKPLSWNWFVLNDSERLCTVNPLLSLPAACPQTYFAAVHPPVHHQGVAGSLCLPALCLTVMTWPHHWHDAAGGCRQPGRKPGGTQQQARMQSGVGKQIHG